eukprot:6656176-Lingulodinium_polyedra.AAC.1
MRRTRRQAGAGYTYLRRVWQGIEFAQVALARCRRALEPSCQYCRAAVGTLRRRHWECPLAA